MQYPEKRASFETFKSNVCHMAKTHGDFNFIKEILCSEDVRTMMDKKWYPEGLYLVGMADYLCNKHGIPLYTGFDQYRTMQLEKPLYPEGIFYQYLASGDESILTKSMEESIPEFRRFNIIEKEVENIA